MSHKFVVALLVAFSALSLTVATGSDDPAKATTLSRFDPTGCWEGNFAIRDEETVAAPFPPNSVLGKQRIETIESGRESLVLKADGRFTQKISVGKNFRHSSTGDWRVVKKYGNLVSIEFRYDGNGKSETPYIFVWTFKDANNATASDPVSESLGYGYSYTREKK